MRKLLIIQDDIANRLVADEEVGLEALFLLGMINTKEKEAAHEARQDETVFAIQYYPGTIKQLVDKVHLISFRQRGNHAKQAEIERLYPTYQGALKQCSEHKLKKWQATIHSVRYIRNLKTGQELYNSDNVFEQHYNRKLEKQ